MKKIKGKNFNIVLFLLVMLLLFYTRFVNLSWGLPFPFHPDERNMAVALQQLKCSELINCLNPYFFAYGQFPLYVGYVLGLLGRLGRLGEAMSFPEAVLILRLISAVASVATFFVMMKIVSIIVPVFSLSFPRRRESIDPHFREDDNGLFRIGDYRLLIASLVFIFSPGLIQFAHFGTTESLLMFFYISTIYLVLLFLNKTISFRLFIVVTAIVCGLALGTKISAAIFLLLPAAIIVRKVKGLVIFLLLTVVVGIISSPYNLISLNNFLSSMRYESAIATGNLMVFYTRQFFEMTPVLFQFTNIFPYTLGLPALVIFILGFFFLPRNKNYNILRLSFLIYFIPNAFLYTKWTRFMAPVFPVMLIIAALFSLNVFNLIKRHPGLPSDSEGLSRIDSGRARSSLARMTFSFVFFILTFILILTGVAYLSVYRNEDVRMKASEWIYSNIPAGSNILSEGGNVVDIPLRFSKYSPSNYHITSFDFYSLDDDPALQSELNRQIIRADYIIIPSRRVVMNTTCEGVQRSEFGVRSEKRCQDLRKKYPLTNAYYDKLLSKKFKEVMKFDSYPKISLFNKTLFESKDIQSEETWSVFDHPVIRIYRKQ